jgi:hypothetical protein
MICPHRDFIHIDTAGYGDKILPQRRRLRDWCASAEKCGSAPTKSQFCNGIRRSARREVCPREVMCRDMRLLSHMLPRDGMLEGADLEVYLGFYRNFGALRQKIADPHQSSRKSQAGDADPHQSSRKSQAVAADPRQLQGARCKERRIQSDAPFFSFFIKVSRITCCILSAARCLSCPAR